MYLYLCFCEHRGCSPTLDIPRRRCEYWYPVHSDSISLWRGQAPELLSAMLWQIQGKVPQSWSISSTTDLHRKKERRQKERVLDENCGEMLNFPLCAARVIDATKVPGAIVECMDWSPMQIEMFVRTNNTESLVEWATHLRNNHLTIT